MAQLSGGDDDTIMRAAAELLGVEYADVVMKDVFPAKKTFYVDQKLLSEDRLELIEQIAYAIKRTLLAGVGIRLYLRTYRTYCCGLLVHHKGAIMSYMAYPPTGQERSHVQDVSVARGGILVSSLNGALPDAPRAVRGCQSSAGGAFARVHIKSRSID